MVRVFSHWMSPRKAAFFVAEETVLVLALLAGAALGPVAAPHPLEARPDVAPALLRATLAALAFAGSLYFGDLYDLHVASKDRAEGRRLLRALGAAVAALAAAYLVLPHVLPMGWLPRGSLTLAAAGGALAVIAVRAAMPAVVGAPVRVLLLGAGERARRLAHAVEEEADQLFEVVGFLASGPGEGATSPLVFIGPLAPVIARTRAQIVVVAVEDRRARLPVDELLACRTRGVQVTNDVSFAEATLKRIPLELVRPSALIFDEGFRVSRSKRAVKRALDLAAATALLVLGAPAMLATAAAILLSDGRPLFYSQERTGALGRTYRIWKFRTMRRDAEELGAAWATDRDPRVLSIGRFLRRSRLDELPQLWNVLRGEMSLVGPRPERPVFLAELKRHYPLFAMRELVKPGLTGWAQLRYGYGATIAEMGRKLEYDLYYIKNTSLFLDLVCLFHTAKTVLSGRGAR
ncbi:MAG TPA: exopolysaccharide biosynthesis polyprenyl glycosylphosphotransferase [Anaeromyxobacteraceae bacterium]|nr:exopolysaccharide biosynthesis polyprenyl glycosylphosphotransferase [Anaeromyxobacteraceae bacterium]